MRLLDATVKRMAVVAIVAGAAGLGIGAAAASQPQMDAALSELRSALSNLQKVTMYKAGHADRARKLIAEAIDEVEAGLAYGRAHGL